ncbi:hypothetical protein B0H63DRAFT_532083 [Podospora didyma]|uniref:FAD-binding PCMH-type domain-containing protein n=1 Tax=Podospora didyma TaxID=330526 RepID=A0AAE0P678_9PEZI|nr:hypothetical protein B0H63DRAFT_532083 [Podospora didyma]
MAPFTCLISYILVILRLIVAVTAANPHHSRNALDIVAQLQKELGPLLSGSSRIFGPDNSQWASAMDRWQELAPPQFQGVVQPGTEDDIAKTVQYLDGKSFDFLVVNQAHAITSTVGKFNGIQIDVKSLKDVSISADNRTVKLQAGTYSYEVTAKLWEHGYITTTTTCACAGIVGPALGGGFGLAQGLYGLSSDNVVSMNVVLANGTAITVNENINADLFYGMRGAGHNFGIVTSLELAIHPADWMPTWYYKGYVFTADHLEALFDELNRFHGNGSTPKLMIANFNGYMIIPAISNKTATDAEKLLAPFNQLNGISQNVTAPYPQIIEAFGVGMESSLCEKDKVHITSAAGLQVFNITAQRQMYDLFNQNLALHPEFGNTVIRMEVYGAEGVRNQDPGKSAYPHRDDYILTAFDALLNPGSDLQGVTRNWAEQTRQLWNAGQPQRLPTTYVNYASGSESLSSIYGYEAWRQEKLLDLKKKYDPYNRFGYYNPIPTTNWPGNRIPGPGPVSGSG